MITNLKEFRKFLEVTHCKRESNEDALKLVTEYYYFVSVELKDAHYSISIHKIFKYSELFKIIMGTNTYQYTVLPNAFAPAVQEFIKVESPSF